LPARFAGGKKSLTKLLEIHREVAAAI